MQLSISERNGNCSDFADLREPSKDTGIACSLKLSQKTNKGQIVLSVSSNGPWLLLMHTLILNVTSSLQTTT